MVAEQNVPRATENFRGMGIQVVMGSRYLGGFVWERGTETQWVRTKVEGWAKLVKTLARVACKHPQSVYAGLQKSLQQEWAFVHGVTPGICNEFGPVEEEIAKAFLPELFGDGESLPGKIRGGSWDGDTI